MSDEHVVLKVDKMTRRFGATCGRCASGDAAQLDRNWCPQCGTVHALVDVSFSLARAEVLGIVGESGSGKSTLMQCLYFDQVPQEGGMYLPQHTADENLFECSAQTRRIIRNTLLGKVYQNPMLGLRMNFSAVSNIAEKLIAAGKRNVGEMESTAIRLLERVRIPSFRRHESPKAFSGGMQQRVQIAKALSTNPPVLLLDEVTTGLDLSVQARVLDLIREIRRESGVSMLLVSHDLGVIRMLADRTLVLLNGRIVEEGLTDQILEDPQHPYTQELVQSLL